MGYTVYKVVFEGDILPGFGQLEVQKKLAKLFAADTAAAGRLLMDGNMEIKRNVSLSEAKSAVRKMAKIGAICYVVPAEISDDTVPNVELKNIPGSVSSKPGMPTAAAFAAYFEKKERHRENDAGFPHELAVQEITEPGRNTTQPRNKSFLMKQGFDKVIEEEIAGQDETESAQRVEITDVNKICDMQRIARQMLAQKRLYE